MGLSGNRAGQPELALLQSLHTVLTGTDFAGKPEGTVGGNLLWQGASRLPSGAADGNIPVRNAGWTAIMILAGLMTDRLRH